MDAAQLLSDRITHEIDMDLLRELQTRVGVDLEKEIELAEKKFNTKIDRVINGITNKNAHETNSL